MGEQDGGGRALGKVAASAQGKVTAIWGKPEEKMVRNRGSEEEILRGHFRWQ